MIGQKLRGFVGQGMSGQRKALTPVVYVYPPRSVTFTVPVTGKYRFAVRGGGGGGGSGGAGLAGASGALVIGDRYLNKGQTVALVVGAVAAFNADGNASTATFPDGSVMTAGGGGEGFTPNPAGVAASTSNLDTLLNGSLATVAGLGNAGGTSGALTGGGAPGKDGFIGTNATSGGLAQGPGAGGKPTNGNGGPGEVIIMQISLRP